MESWIFLSITYGLLCGTSDLFKKQALKNVPVIHTLILFNFVILAILIVAGGNYALELSDYFFIFFKSFCVFLGWLIGFKAIKLIDISNYSTLMLSKVIFSGLLGCLFLNEILGLNKILGFIIISIGIFIANIKKRDKKLKLKYVFMVLASSALISISLFLDKIILINLSVFSLQFYYTITLIIFYLIYLIIKSEQFNFTYVKNELSVVNLGIITYIADYIHFIAAQDVNSSVVVMTLTRHSSLIITVFIGSLIFHEKNLFLKFISVLIIIVGLIVTVI